MSEIGEEVDRIEDVVYSNVVGEVPEPTKPSARPEIATESSTLNEKVPESSNLTLDEKTEPSVISALRTKPRFHLPSATLPIYLRRARRAIYNYLTSVYVRDVKPPVVSSTTVTVHRMARTRRLVTSLTRLLATKSDLIAQIKKRLLTQGEWTLGSDPELYIHLGDILGLQLSVLVMTPADQPWQTIY